MINQSRKFSQILDGLRSETVLKWPIQISDISDNSS